MMMKVRCGAVGTGMGGRTDAVRPRATQRLETPGGGGLIVAARRWRGRKARLGSGVRRATETESLELFEVEIPVEGRTNADEGMVLVVNGMNGAVEEQILCGGPPAAAAAAAAAAVAVSEQSNGSAVALADGPASRPALLSTAEPLAMAASGVLSVQAVDAAAPQGVSIAGMSVVEDTAKEVMETERLGEPKESMEGLELKGSVAGMLMLNLGAALFGSNQVVIKATEDMLSPGALSAIRFGIAALCFAPWIIKGLRNQKMWFPAAELGFWLFGGYTAQAVGLFTTTAARGAFTGTFTVLAVPILVGLSGRKISMNTWIAAVGALLGVGLLTTSGADPNIGDLWCIVSAILFGVHKWRSEEITARFGETNELVSLQILTLAVLSTFFILPDLSHMAQDMTVQELFQKATNLPWLSLAYMGLGTTALCLYLEMTSLKEVSAPLAALIYTAEPLWGALFAYLFLDERWGAMGWLGAGLIVSSSLFSQLSGDSERLGQQIEQTAFHKEKIP